MEAAYHLGACKPEDFPRWCDERARPFYEAARYSFLEPLYRRSLEIREKVLGPEHPETAINLNHLAALLNDQGKYDEAEPLYIRSLEIKEKVLGPEHPETAFSLIGLAELLYFQDKYEEAEPYYRKALEIAETALGSEHPKIRKFSEDYQKLKHILSGQASS